MKRIVLKKLTLSGEKKRPAILEFESGLNVITGDSDTGKTYAFQCLNYILGAEKTPKTIPEAEGYQRLSLDFIANGKQYSLERLIGDSKITVTFNGESRTFQCKHDATSTNNLSRFMLEIILESSDIVQVKKNQDNTKRTLSFRDLIHLCTVDETGIIAERSAFQSEQYSERTVRSSIFKYVISGKDDSELLQREDASEENTKRAGVVQFLQQKKTALRDKIESIENNENYKLFSTSKTLFNSQRQINSLRIQIAEANSRVLKKQKELDAIRKLCFLDEAKISDFKNLDRHYENEVHKMRLISTYADFLEQMPHLGCPICGSEFGKTSGINDDESRELFEYYRKHSLEIIKKRREISETIDIIETRLQSNKSKIISLENHIKEEHDKVNNLQSQLFKYNKNILMARQLDAMNKELDIYRQELIAVEGDIIAYSEKVKASKQAVLTSSAIFHSYCETIKKTLSTWGIDKIESVDFDSKSLDISINNISRTNWGKGYRAFFMSAMTISLMRYCFQNGKPHPGFVIIDSPLVSLKERQLDSKGEWINDYMEKKMIEDILQEDSLNQVIIFENKDLKFDLNYNYIEFNHDGNGRIGFIEQDT